MPAPGSVSSGSLVSSRGLQLDNGLNSYRQRELFEDGTGQFRLGTIATGSSVGPNTIPKYFNSHTDLPAAGYAYVGEAVDEFGNQHPGFCAQDGDRYFVVGVDAVKYGRFYTYQSYSVDGFSVFTTLEQNYDLSQPTGNQPAVPFNELVTYDYATGQVTRTVVSVACYCGGTLVLTAKGEVAIEALAQGDVVVTASGQLRPVQWIGCRSYAGRFLATNPGVQPVRFHAGSLGGGLPRRDLMVSPDHSMFLDGVLVPARCLVNGRSVVQERVMERVDYYHVELDSHDVILAEGAPSETFVDDDSRGVFLNAVEWSQAHPGQEPAAAVFCAPRVTNGPQMDAIRQRLDAVALDLPVAAFMDSKDAA